MRLSPVQVAVLVVAWALVVPAVLVFCLAAGWSTVGAGVSTALLALAVPVFVAHVVPRRLGSDPYHHALFGAWLVLCGVAAYRLAHVSVFMLDPEATRYAINPPVRDVDDPDFARPFLPKHCCFTAYVVADELALEGRAIYLLENYRGNDGGLPTTTHTDIGDVLHIDIYQYPPPFLLLPRLLMIGQDFFGARTLWYAICLGAFCACVTALGAWMCNGAFRAPWLALPMVLLAPATLTALQIGNVHILIVCLSLLSMLAFEQQRNAIGGLLLAYATLSKIFPGILLVYLLLRGRWAALSWTCAWVIGLCGATIAIYGTAPFNEFVSYQLPRIADGDAFWFTRDMTRAIAVNTAVEGLAWRLNWLGLLSEVDPAKLASILKWAHTALVGLAAVTLGIAHRRALPGPETTVAPAAPALMAQSWLALLVLGQMRSPFLPWPYGNVALLWLLVLFVPNCGGQWRLVGLLGVAWLLLGTFVPLPIGPQTPEADVCYTGVATVLAVLLCCVAIARGLRLPNGQPQEAAMARQTERPALAAHQAANPPHE